MSKEKNATGTILIVLGVLSFLITIKSVFTDFGYDNAYTIALSFRHLNGDSLFKEIWDTSQTSIFVTDLLMVLYYFIFKTYTGVALYLQFCGAILYALTSLIFYKALSLYSSKETAAFAAIFLFTFRIKQSVFLAYADQQIFFSILVFSIILFFIKEQSKKYLLVIAGIFMACEVLSYPSALIAFPLICIFLLKNTEEPKRNSGVFFLTCAISGVIYVMFFLFKIGVDGFLNTLRFIFSGDSHGLNDNLKSLFTLNYWKGFLLACAGITLAVLISYVIKKLSKKEDIFWVAFGISLFLIEIVAILFPFEKFDWTCCFYIIPSMLIVIGSMGYSELSKEERIIWKLALVVSLSSFVATFLFTNLGIITILAYTVLSGAVAIIPISKKIKGKKGVIFVASVCLLIIFHRGMVVWGYSNSFGVQYIYQVNNYIRTGPAKYIFCDRDSANRVRDIEADFRANIDTNEAYLLLNSWLYDPAIYLFNNGPICNPNVTDTPTYNETLLDYFDNFPKKVPSVVAVEKTGSVQSETVNSWLNMNYEKTAEGNRYYFYRKK